MTDSEMIDELRTATESEEEEKVLRSYLFKAKQKILNRLYPYEEDAAERDVPLRWHSKQVEIATYLMNKRGAEGELVHSENGVSRTYSLGDIPYEMIADITPLCGIFG